MTTEETEQVAENNALMMEDSKPVTKPTKRGDRRHIKEKFLCRDHVAVPGRRPKHRTAELDEGDLPKSKKLVTCRKCNKTHPKGKDHKCGSNRFARLKEAKRGRRELRKVNGHASTIVVVGVEVVKKTVVEVYRDDGSQAKLGDVLKK